MFVDLLNHREKVILLLEIFIILIDICLILIVLMVFL